MPWFNGYPSNKTAKSNTPIVAGANRFELPSTGIKILCLNRLATPLYKRTIAPIRPFLPYAFAKRLVSRMSSHNHTIAKLLPMHR